MSFSIANRITIGRILFVPVFISTIVYYSPQNDCLRFVALGIFSLAMGLDIIDGYVARTAHQKTRAGAILDPLADKLLLMSAFISLFAAGQEFPHFGFPRWLVIAVISRDVILLIGGMLIYVVYHELSIGATFWGKMSTFFQAVTIIFMLLQWPFTALWYVTAAFVAVSGIDYIFRGIKIINSSI